MQSAIAETSDKLRPILIASLAALLHPVTNARGAPPAYPTALVKTDRFAGPVADAGDAAFGNFDSNRILDAVFLDESGLSCVVDLPVFAVPVVVPGSFTAVATVPGGGPEGRDAFATVGSGGLLLWTYDTSARQVLPEAFQDPTWQGARAVRTGRDAFGRPLLAGLSADGTLLLRAVLEGAGLAARASVPLGHPATALALLESGGATASTVVVAGASGVIAYPGAGDGAASVWAAFPPATYEALEALPQTAGDDLVALARTGPFQCVMSGNAAGLHSALALGTDFGAVSLAAVELEQEAPRDLVMNATSAGELVVFRDTGSFPRFDTLYWANFLVAPEDGMHAPDPGRSARLLVADADGDGDDDVIFADGPTSAFVVYRNSLVDESALRYRLSAVDHLQSGPAGAQIRFVFDGPEPPPPGATHVEVRLFEVPPDGQWADPDPRVAELYALPISNLDSLATLPAPEQIGAQVKYLAVVRAVAIQEGVETLGFPASAFDLSFPASTFAVVPDGGSQAGGDGDPIPINTIIPLPRPHAGGTLPNPPVVNPIPGGGI